MAIKKRLDLVHVVVPFLVGGRVRADVVHAHPMGPGADPHLAARSASRQKLPKGAALKRVVEPAGITEHRHAGAMPHHRMWADVIKRHETARLHLTVAGVPEVKRREQLFEVAVFPALGLRRRKQSPVNREHSTDGHARVDAEWAEVVFIEARE